VRRSLPIVWMSPVFVLTSACVTLFGDLGPAPDPSMSAVAGLEGCWVGPFGGTTVEECWGRASSGTMFGHSRGVTSGRTVSFEYLRVERRGGDLVYVASPQGGPPTEFTRRPGDDGALVFENAAHDFPKRIVYFVSSANLGVRLEGVEEGAPKAVDFTLRRR